MKKKVWAGVVLGGFFLAGGAAAAAVFPNKPVTIIVPYAAGGRTDTLGRIFAQVFQKHLGQSVVILNKGGAGSVLGTREAIKARPDGHTLLLTSTAAVAARYLLPDQPELWNHLEPIARLDFDPMFLAASKKSGWGSLAELIAFAKKNPKQVKVGAQRGSAMFLYTNAFVKAGGIDPTYIYFSGGGEAKVALAGGHIDLYFDAGYVYQPLVDAEKALFLGVSAESRQPRFPNVPTLREQGIPLTWGAWQGLFAPKEVPPEVLNVLVEAFRKTTQDRGLLEMAEKNQISIAYLPGADFNQFLKKEDATYRELATEIGLYKPRR